ncbi:pentapeptide repeat-containing protein [Streptosporangium sp. NPDC050855]|uniref:pentapeptide repeat-containing protein n=1 Tax=Streptosporangium sp. NPDC050855 TaxID=3366194 RepID=UPI0037B5510B
MADHLAFAGLREVRHTIIRLIGAQLRESAAVSRQGHALDFTGVIFDGGDFHRATFSAGTVDFRGATSSGSGVVFSGATFAGATVNFHDTPLFNANADSSKTERREVVLRGLPNPAPMGLLLPTKRTGTAIRPQRREDGQATT